MNEVKTVGCYYQAEDGGWYITDEAKAEATAMYYSGRLAYDQQDSRHPVGVYNSAGEVVRYNTKQDNG